MDGEKSVAEWITNLLGCYRTEVCTEVSKLLLSSELEKNGARFHHSHGGYELLWSMEEPSRWVVYILYTVM
jgi:hypothetical protein